MKFKKILLISLLLAILTLGAVSASEDLDNITSQEDALKVSDDASDIVGENTVKQNDSPDFIGNEGDDDGGDDDENDNDTFTEVAIKIPDEVEIGGGDGIDIELPEDAKGHLLIKANNTKILYDQDVDGEIDDDFSVSLDSLGCGLFYISAIFTPTNDKYGIVTNESYVNITYNITIDADDVYLYGKTDNLIYINAPPEILNQVVVTINGNKYTLTNVPGTASKAYIDISDFSIGKYDIKASFAGNNKYKAYTTNETIQVITGIDTVASEIAYNSEQYITLTLPGQSQGKLILSVDNQKFESAFVNGVARVKFPTSRIGSYYYDVTFTGSEYEIDNITNGYVFVEPKITVPSEMTVGEDKKLTIEYNADAGATFVITSDDEQLDTVLIAPGSVSLKDLDDGEISISVLFYYANIPHPYDFDVLVHSLPFRFVGVKNINMNYGQTTIYPITLYGTNGKLLEEDEYIDVKIGKKTYEGYTNSRGVVNFKIPSSVLPGKYTVTLIYDDGDNQFTATSKLVVKQTLSLKKASVKKSAKSLVLTATLKKLGKKLIKNKKIIFKFNGKKFTAKTNAKGVAKVTIKENVLKKLKAGKKIKYTATYLKNTVKQTAVVKK